MIGGQDALIVVLHRDGTVSLLWQALRITGERDVVFVGQRRYDGG